MGVLTETEQRFADEQSKLQTEIDDLQTKLRDRQVKLRNAAKDQLRVHDETLGSFVRAAKLDDVDPALCPVLRRVVYCRGTAGPRG